MNIAKYIDHTVLKPVTVAADVEQLCREAKEYGFAAVCVPPYYVGFAKGLLEGSGVKVATVAGFPFGYSSVESKVAELVGAIAAGADEIDMVHNIAAAKNADWSYLVNEVELCTQVAHAAGKQVKIIVESGVLSDAELQHCCEIYTPIGIDFMKTSTGYAEVGATTHAVKLMRQFLPGGIAIKASGGIRTYTFAKELVDAGAARLGCSASVAIVQEAMQQ